MKKFLFLIMVLAISQQISLATTTMGSYDPGLINSQYMKEIKIFEAGRSKPEIFKIDTPLQKTFTLKQVNFVNNEACNSDELQSLIADKIGKEMAPSDLALMERSIMKYYQSKGYISAIATVTNTDKNSGVITINVKEGQENSVKVEEPNAADAEKIQNVPSDGN